jgi:hypothetical protein
MRFIPDLPLLSPPLSPTRLTELVFVFTTTPDEFLDVVIFILVQ